MGVWFLVENSAQLWSTSPPKKATQQFLGSLPASCCAEKKNCRKCPVISAAISEAHPEGILGQFWNTLWGPPTIQELMYFHFWTWKLANLEGDMFGYRTVCYLCDTIKKYNTIIYVITNIIYIYTVHILPQIINTLNGDKRLQPSLHFGFPRLSGWYVIDINRTFTADVDDLHIWNQVQSHRRSWMVKRSSSVL